MTNPLWTLSVILILACNTVATAEKTYELPADINTPVLKIEQFFLEKGSDTPPLIIVYPDGRVVKPIVDDHEDDYIIKLSKKQLNKLLSEIIEDNKFFDMNTQDIKNEVVSEQRQKRIRKSYEFRIELNLAGRLHTVSLGHGWVYQRLLRGRTKHPKAKVFHRFLNIEERCHQLSRWTLVGGEENMQKILKTANEKTQEAYPDTSKITEANIISLTPKEGRVQIYFGVAKTLNNPSLFVIINKARDKDSFDVKVEINHPRKFHQR